MAEVSMITKTLRNVSFNAAKLLNYVLNRVLKSFLPFGLFPIQGGEVIDKVMMIKDVHGPEAWVSKKIKNWTESI